MSGCLNASPVRDEGGKIVIRPNPYARKDSGSFYTPQELVDLIVERTLKPLVEERLTTFEEKSRRTRARYGGPSRYAGPNLKNLTRRKPS